MTGIFFEQPILNNPCAYPGRHPELDKDGQPTQQIMDNLRRADFVTPILKPKKRKNSADQTQMQFGDPAGISTDAQQYDFTATGFEKFGRMAALKARMNADLHMAEDLKNTGKGNLFVIFGEPDIDIQHTDDNRLRVKVNGVDVFHPNTGEVRSDGPEGIACWFIGTDYNSESFFVRHAYFLGASDPYKSLRTTLKAEINAEAWETLHSDTSRPFEKPESGRIAVKVINHLGDEVMKVFRIDQR